MLKFDFVFDEGKYKKRSENRSILFICIHGQCWGPGNFFSGTGLSAPSKKAKLLDPGSRFYKFLITAPAPSKKVQFSDSGLRAPGSLFRGFYRLQL